MLATGVVYEDPGCGCAGTRSNGATARAARTRSWRSPTTRVVIPAEDGGFHLVEEYRYPIGRRTWSFPQGGWPSGQTGGPAELARLELSQETGLRAGVLARLGFLHCAHGFSSQGGHFFVATELEPGPPEREHEEQDMRQAWIPRARFEEMIGEGLITDASTLAAYALLLMSERRAGC